MTTISREQLKSDIDTLDSEYLDLAYRIIRQLPHVAEAAEVAEDVAGQGSFSQRWRGKLGSPEFTQDELDSDARLSYLARRYQL
jgi:hypothetical protein